MGCEAPSAWEDEVVLPCAGFLVSAHAPFSKEGRLNVGALDKEHRALSLQAIREYIERAASVPALHTIVVHPCPRLWDETRGKEHPLEAVGDYEVFIRSLQELAQLCGELGLDLVMENNRAYWEGIPDDQPYDPERHDENVREYFGTSPESWAQVPRDVSASNFGLCLDTSHSTTYAHRFAEAERAAVLERYLELGGERIWHVHWNDSILEGIEGRPDRHLPLGQGSLPTDHHRRIWNWPSARSWTLEHWVDEETLVAELDFIKHL